MLCRLSWIYLLNRNSQSKLVAAYYLDMILDPIDRRPFLCAGLEEEEYTKVGTKSWTCRDRYRIMPLDSPNPTVGRPQVPASVGTMHSPVSGGVEYRLDAPMMAIGEHIGLGSAGDRLLEF